MNRNRIVNHPILGTLKEQSTVTFTFDGKTYSGYENDTIASALLANGIRTLRLHEHSGNERGIYCNIGHCFECRVTVNGIPNIRACITPIEHNMVVESGKQLPSPLDPSNEKIPKTYQQYEQMKDGEES
jgi:sarcosine oxidase subunit alpha